MSNFSFSDTDQALWLYHFDSAGVYIGSGLAVIPAGTGLPAKTTLQPCQPSNGFTGVWNGEKWNYVEDKRGMRYWNKYGVGSVVLSVDETIPEDAIFIEPPKKDSGQVVIFQNGEWQILTNNTGKVYYDQYGIAYAVPDAYFTLPEGYTMVTPPENKPGYTVSWNGIEWGYLEDYRGKTAYLKNNGSAITVTNPGPLPNEYTFTAPTTQYDEWEDGEWHTNADALKAAQVASAKERKNLLWVEASDEIAVLSDAIKFNMATEQEKVRFDSLSEYRVLIMRVNPDDAPNISWPVKP
ncbi:virus tail fiber assembly protein lambda gpK [Raoultella sp. BIGb0138]|uniref:tail fiber assembly protein n=1 Tax=Raoultella sp. BIGb0138 TaxID=2485115 RepID=UPI0010476100|nr:tail fiber assembly protein [Raoultella sp. BIGb0138]TCW17363.1 virus tail fiber assembly protein lambda gpK [Raoultella sp. BIGb0138]